MLFFAFYSLFNIYHLIRFGFSSFVNILIIILYIVASVVLIIFSINLLFTIDWTTELINFQAINSSSPNF